MKELHPKTAMPVRVLIYDDNQDLRESLQTLLTNEPGFAIAAMLDNVETVETDIAQMQPDVILMDIDMPGINGVEGVKRIRKIYPELPIIMLTVFEDNENIFNAVYSGASGYILKRHAAEEIPGAIKDVLEGGAPMTSSVAKKILQLLPPARNQDIKSVQLSEKETEILRLLVSGFSYKMIAERTKISIDGVRFHIKKIYDKLHVHSATEAVSKAIKDRLV